MYGSIPALLSAVVNPPITSFSYHMTWLMLRYSSEAIAVITVDSCPVLMFR